MDKIIAACGNDCSVCPRHLPKTQEELLQTSELWYKIGYRNQIVSTTEISCSGCSANNWCRYKIINCVIEKGVSTCGECPEYICEKIQECFDVTESFRRTCKMNCSRAEYEVLVEAFFQKKKNLDLICGKNRVNFAIEELNIQ